MNSSNMNQPVQYESTSPELSTSFVLFKQLERISLCLSLSLFLNPDNLTGEDLNDQLACKLHCPNCPIYCTRSRQVKSHPNKKTPSTKTSPLHLSAHLSVSSQWIPTRASQTPSCKSSNTPMAPSRAPSCLSLLPTPTRRFSPKTSP